MWLGGALTVLAGLNDILVITAVVALFVLLTEVTSNTASATLGLPVMAALGPSVGVEPLALMAAAAMGASMAFMLPVATPPNAIVFGSGYIRAQEMRRAGIWLNIAAIIAITLTIWIAFVVLCAVAFTCTAPGRIVYPDDEIVFQTTASLWEDGDLSIPGIQVRLEPLLTCTS